jgi:hypothetical protein
VSRRKQVVAVASTLALAVAGLGVGAMPAAAAASDQHVIVVGIDGLRFDKIAPANATNLEALIASGYSSTTWLYAAPMSQTLSGPGWATNLTGVWPDKHRVLSNSWGTSSNITQYPDFLSRLETANPALSTYAAATWAPIIDGSAGSPLITSAVDTRYVSTGDSDTAANVLGQLGKTAAPNASFVHFDDVDEAGHADGAASSEYLAAVAEIDGYVGKIRQAVAKRPTSEQWSIIVTADHGHTDAGGHGGNTPPERSSFIIKTGPGITRTTPAVKPKNVDIAADVLSTFGVPIPAALDGRPLATASTDPFDSMVGSLAPAVDETAIPAATKGWTHAVPPGWSIDDTGMGTGGVTEWRGWSLTDDDFWTKTDPGQGRETNVRARGVFAVADSDEWSDKAHTGLFNSRLVSAPYAVSAGSTATITFGSHYRKEGNETASVLVSFDNGATWTTASTLAGDSTAAIQTVTVAVPAGKTSMRVAWALTNGDNNWYWAVDAPRVG